WTGGVLDPQLPTPAAPTARDTDQAQAIRDFGGDPAAVDEPVLQSRVLIVDILEISHLALESQHLTLQPRDVLGSDIADNAARHDGIHKISMAKQRVIHAQLVLFQPEKLRQPESERGIVAEKAEIAQ